MRAPSVLTSLVITLGIATACKGGGTTHGPDTPAAPAAPVAPEFTATRWIPATPTYLISARSVNAAQHGIRDLVDALGVPLGHGTDDLSRASRDVLQVDVLSPDPVAAIGVDLEGGIAVFSEDVDPTLVVHLAAPDQTQGFFERIRARGASTQSVIIDGTELFTTKLAPGVHVSWAIAGDWLWVHFALAGAPDSTTWFAPNRTATAAWGDQWRWAAKQGDRLARRAPQLVGFANVSTLVSRYAARVKDAAACARLIEPVGRVGLALDSDGPRAAGRIALDLGPASAGVTAATLAIPEGWTAASSKAAVALQWNLDLPVLFGWLAPCVKALDLGDAVAQISTAGVRSARAFVESVDLDDKKGRGVLSVDLARKTFFQDRLDDIPIRSTLESDRRYGPLRGKELSVPFVATVEYILTDKLGFVAMGEGLLAAVVGGGTSVAAPLFAVDVVPSRIPEKTWSELLQLAGFPNDQMVVRRMMRWQDGHISLAVEGRELVFEARGTRR